MQYYSRMYKLFWQIRTSSAASVRVFKKYITFFCVRTSPDVDFMSQSLSYKSPIQRKTISRSSEVGSKGANSTSKLRYTRRLSLIEKISQWKSWIASQNNEWRMHSPQSPSGQLFAVKPAQDFMGYTIID